MRLEDEFKIDDRMSDALTKDDLKAVKNVIIDLSSRTQEILIQQDRENVKEELFTKAQAVSKLLSTDTVRNYFLINYKAIHFIR